MALERKVKSSKNWSLGISKKKSDPKPVEKKQFQWVLIEPDTPNKSGYVDAVSMNEAKMILRKQGVRFTYVKLVAVKKVKIKEDHIVLFLRQWSAVQSAGVPVTDGIKMIADTTEYQGLRKMLLKIYQSLAEGSSLAESFAQFPRWFDPVSIALLKAAQEAGILDSVLRRMATARERRRILDKKTKSALLYPGITVFVMFIVVTILMIKVIPVFAKLFHSFGGQLPFLTRQVVNLSDWMKGHALIVFLLPLIIFAVLRYLYRHHVKARWIMDRIFFRLPVFGELLLKAATARFCQIFAEMQGAGVPILSTLDTLSNVSGNMIIDSGVIKAREAVARGGRISAALRDSAFPPLAVQMISVGEETGNLETMLNKTGEFYESEVNEMVNRLSTLLEPMIMVVLGVVVGTLVIAMYLPMLDMGSVILHGTGVK